MGRSGGEERGSEAIPNRLLQGFPEHESCAEESNAIFQSQDEVVCSGLRRLVRSQDLHTFREGELGSGKKEVRSL